MGQGNSNLSEDSVQELRQSTRFSGKEIKELYEKFRLDFPDGIITEDRFVTMYASMFPNGDATKFAQLIFNAYDLDGNGEIDFHEFMCTLSVASKGTVDEKLQWAFQLYDLNKDGRVSRQEAVEMISAIYRMRGIAMSSDKAEEAALQLFIYLDKNKDDSLSQAEFVTAVKNSRAVREMVQGSM